MKKMLHIETRQYPKKERKWPRVEPSLPLGLLDQDIAILPELWPEMAPIYTFYDFRKSHFSDIKSYEVLGDIHAAVTAIGVAVLGFTAKDVGTHSNRGGFAMMMYLAGVPVFTIMKM